MIYNNFIIFTTDIDQSTLELFDAEPIVDESEDETIDPSHAEARVPAIIILIIAFLLKFQAVFKISDNAIMVLLKFFKYLLITIGKHLKIPTLQQGINLPLSLNGCRSLVGIKHRPYKEYVVCPCHMLFDPEAPQLIKGTTANRRSVMCKNLMFPNHPQARFRMPCNTMLMNTVKKIGNKIDFRARKIYCYYGLKAALNHLLTRPALLSMCNSWKDRLMEGDIMGDFIDGKVWHEEMEKFADSPFNIMGFLINIDWFQPFKDISYSVGVIYAVIVNLPRNIRYKDENVIIIGVIPGPKEPKHDINSYLGPLVKELLELQSGMWLGMQFIRGILVCISSDIPATWLCGTQRFKKDVLVA